MDNRHQGNDPPRRDDLEFHLPRGEFGFRDSQGEFDNKNGEYFSEQEDCFKRRSSHIRRMAMMLTCVTAVGLAAPGLGTKAEPATVTEASVETERADIPESESPSEPEIPSGPESTTASEPAEEEMPYRLSEEQQAFISRVYQAFDEDDRDALEALKDEEVFWSFLEGELKGKVVEKKWR